MADVASILSVSAQGSKLALELYKLATSTVPGVTEDFNSLARSVSNLCLAIKQVGSLIVENDRLPSPAAISDLEDVLDQSKAAFSGIRSTLVTQPGPPSPAQHARLNSTATSPSPVARARLGYLSAHLDSLKSTLSVILQTLYTVQVISWTRTGPMTGPQSADATISDQETQLEALVIEQQLSFLQASKRYEKWRSRDRQLLETSNSNILVAFDDRSGGPKLADLLRYQHRSLIHLDTSHSKDEWLVSICEVSDSHVDQLIKKWTLLHELDALSPEEEMAIREQKRQSQQPTVESDSSGDEVGELPNIRHATPHPRRSRNGRFATPDSPSLPIPGSRLRPSDKLAVPSPYRPGVNARGSSVDLPESTKADISVSPVAAAAAVEAQEDGDSGLGIPWTLRTRDHYWKYIDGKVNKTDTDLPPSTAYSDRTSWTEVTLSWVCKEALNEVRYPHTQMQKVNKDSNRTVMEPCFRIERALTFEQVQQLVERTVEIYRQGRPSPSRQPKRQSFAQHMQAQQTGAAPHNPQLRHSFSSYTFSPPSLDRSASLPGAPPPMYPPHPTMNANASTSRLPTYPSNPLPNPFASTTNLPIPPPPPLQIPSYQPNSSYPPFPNSAPPQFQQHLYQPHLTPGFPFPGTHMSSPVPPASSSQEERRRSSYNSTRESRQDRERDRERDRRDSGASDTDESAHHRRRRSSRREKDHHLSKKNVKRLGTMATVGGLAALLEGL